MAQAIDTVRISGRNQFLLLFGLRVQKVNINLERVFLAQGLLLSNTAHTLSLKAIFAAGEHRTYRRFCAWRWPETNGAPVCPRCRCLDTCDLKVRRRFKCADCSHQLSATCCLLRGRQATRHAAVRRSNERPYRRETPLFEPATSRNTHRRQGL